MFPSLPARWLAVLPAMAAALAAAAQPAPASAPRAEEAATRAPTTLSYKSALEGYRPFTDDKPVPWKEANETVRQRGGWKAYAEEAAGGAGGGASEAPAAHQGHAMPMPPASKEKKP
ncbi:hypothetical protein [Variovorax paradoxus]|uniref:Uncharacterized protein n=1 Tax=Variovorax paradoxus TaxID=34073 RepID=A0AAW8EIU8_VARPD|nr:hypothetical protein [Variovorax paradoxus]MDP9971916.1 hypothetical protein [Variovorax paradoxus]